MGLLINVVFVLLEEGDWKIFRCEHQLVRVLEFVLDVVYSWFILVVLNTKLIFKHLFVVVFFSLGFKVSKLLGFGSTLIHIWTWSSESTLPRTTS